MGRPGKTDPSLKKPLGLEMKGSPYSMNQPLHGNAFIGAKVKAEQQGKNSFNVDGKTFPVKKDPSEGPEFVGALLAGAGKLLAKKAVSKVGGSIIKKGMMDMASGGLKNAISGSMDGLSAPTLAPKGKTGMGKALSTIGSSIKEGVRGLGEGIAGKAGGSPKGFGDKVKNYIGSLDLITDSNPDGSIRKETDKPSTAADSDKNISDLTSNEANSTVPDNSGSIPQTSIGNDNTAKPTVGDPYGNADERKAYVQSQKPSGMNMEGPLNKVKKMCRR